MKCEIAVCFEENWSRVYGKRVKNYVISFLWATLLRQNLTRLTSDNKMKRQGRVSQVGEQTHTHTTKKEHARN